jgi:hypothetical protein
MSLRDLTTLIVVVGAVPATAFPVLYAAWAPWWRSPEGRHLMGFTVTVAAFLDLILAVRWLGPFPGLPAVLVVLYAAVALLLWRRLFLLIRAQRKPRRPLAAAHHDHEETR